MDDEELMLCGEMGKDARAFARKFMALRKDAERYRWLRASKSGTIRLDGDPTAHNDTRWLAPQYVHWGNDLTLDAAIDAAMAVGAA